MFDASKPLKVSIFSGGIKTFTVAYPSDADWREFFHGQTVVTARSSDGPGVESRAVGVEEAALKVIRRVVRKEEGGPELDAYDAAEIIRKLDHVAVQSSTVEGSAVRIVIGALRGKDGPRIGGLAHTLRLPSQRQIVEYRRGALRVVERQKGTETRQPIEPGEKLYDELVMANEGYVGAVPANHKASVAEEVIAAVNRLIDESEDASPEA